MPLPIIPHDKALHAVYGAALGLAGALAALATGQAMWAGALMAALAFATAKEAYDGYTGRGTQDGWDIVATVLGAVPCAIVGAV